MVVWCLGVEVTGGPESCVATSVLVFLAGLPSSLLVVLSGPSFVVESHGIVLLPGWMGIGIPVPMAFARPCRRAPGSFYAMAHLVSTRQSCLPVLGAALRLQLSPTASPFARMSEDGGEVGHGVLHA